jgi:hypothetical protein
VSELTVSLNRERLHRIEAADTFEATGPFDVVLDNYGESVHVHLHLDDDLSQVAELSGGNHYVQREDSVAVHVRARPVDDPVTGKLKVVTGYGSETAYVEVTVAPGGPQKPPVRVDESLNRPKGAKQSDEETTPEVTAESGAADGGRPRTVTLGDFLPARTDLPVVGLGLVAVLIAAAIATVVSGSVVTFGAGVVVGAVLAALVFALR